MEFEVGEEVEINGKVLSKNNEVMNLVETRGVIKKIENGHYYVETEYGVHYLSSERIQKV